MNASKLYSRNDNSMTIGNSSFMANCEGIVDKRSSNRAKQPKQTFYFNSKRSRMNKTIASSFNKSGNQTTEVANVSSSQKRSGSGKAKKPKSDRQMSRNTRKGVIYTFAPVMKMSLK